MAHKADVSGVPTLPQCNQMETDNRWGYKYQI